jgi:membrane-associated phospholipid phosphatase
MRNYLVFLTCLFFSFKLFGQNLDINILKKINSTNNLPSDNFFKFVSDYNSAVIVGVPLCIGVIGLINHDRDMQMNSGGIILANAINFGLTEVLKYSIDRPRPFETYPFITKKSGGGNPSFPSGHTSAAFVTATSLSLAYPKWYIIVPSFAWAGTVAYSRMYLGVHYPSDVLGGIIVGMGSSFIAFKAQKWMNTKYFNKP